MEEKKVGNVWTHVIMWGVVALLTVWDIWAVVNSTPGDTESRTILRIAQEWHTIPLCFGLICGHLFWPRLKRPFGISRTVGMYVIMVPTLLLALVLDFFFKAPLMMMPFFPALGYALGHFCWPMHPSTDGA